MNFRNHTDYHSCGSRFPSKTYLATDVWLGKTRHHFLPVECTLRSIKHLLPIDNVYAITAQLRISYHGGHCWSSELSQPSRPRDSFFPLAPDIAHSGAMKSRPWEKAFRLKPP